MAAVNRNNRPSLTAMRVTGLPKGGRHVDTVSTTRGEMKAVPLARVYVADIMSSVWKLLKINE